MNDILMNFDESQKCQTPGHEHVVVKGLFWNVIQRRRHNESQNGRRFSMNCTEWHTVR